ncbi:MAG TPA: hypothetical protein VIG49_14280, partial [Acetobacteraceae bacterium]
LVVAGSATMGTHAAAPVTVHFAAAHTAYGPIRASGEGISYFTLRNGFDPGARFMTRPENRVALRAVAGRRHREAVAGPLPAAGPASETLLGPDPDGMGAWRYRLAAGQSVVGANPATGRGQYWVVVGGTMLHEGEALPAKSCTFIYPDAAPFVAHAGAAGLDVVAMQFPLRD